MVKVSVIVPAYNAAETLPATLQSVLDQTFSDFELIVIDDGSSDGTAEMAQAIAQQITQKQQDLQEQQPSQETQQSPQEKQQPTGEKATSAQLDSNAQPSIQVFSFDNQGAATARNRGIEKAQGELITFLDADDLWSEDKLQAQVEALEANPKAAVAYSWTDYIDEQGNPLYPGTHNRDEGDVLVRLFMGNFIENGSNLMVRATALKQVGGFIPELASVHDWELWLRLAAEFEFVLVPKAQIFYRIMPGSISSNWARQEQNTRRVIDAMVEKYGDRLRPHRSESLSHLYQYLTCRSLSLGQTRADRGASFKFYALSLFHNPQLLRQRTRLMFILLAKICLGLLFPPNLQSSLLSSMFKIQDLDPWFYDISLLRWLFRDDVKRQLPPLYRAFAEYAAAFERRSNLSRLKGGRYLHWLILNLYRYLPLNSAFPVELNGFKLFCDLEDPRFFLVLRELGNETQELSLLEQLLEPGDSFIDVGANHGSFSMTAGSKMGQAGQIIAIEPQPKLAKLVKKSLALNDFCPYQVHQVACGQIPNPGSDPDSGAATVDLYIPIHSSGMAGMFEGFSGQGKTQKISVPLVPLDELTKTTKFSGKLVMKVDVEGAEHIVLQSATQLLSKYQPLMMMEINPEAMKAAGTSAETLIQELQTLGYESYLEVTEANALHPLKALDGSNYHNVLLIPRRYQEFVEVTIVGQTEEKSGTPSEEHRAAAIA